MVRVRQTALIALLMVIGFQSVSGDLQVNATDNASISVSIASQTWVNIDPEIMSWVDVDPGSVGDNDTEANHYYAIQVENIGSINITNLWFNTSYPSTRPYGTGVASNYNAGNFVVLSRETGGYFFANKLEYNETRTLSYLVDPSGRMPPDGSTYKYGRFRNVTKEYFWFVEPNANDQCNATGVNFWIGGTPHTREDTGSNDFSSCSGTLTNPGSGCGTGTLTQDSNHPDWAYADVSVHGMNYTVAVYSDCTKVFFSHWNKDAPGGELGSYTSYFNTAPINPGDSIIARVKVFVPYGVPMGTVSQGIITAVVNDA